MIPHGGKHPGDQSSPDQPERLFAQLHLTHAGEPTTYAEAQGDPTWRATMEQELKSIEQNRTWELVPLPDGHAPSPSNGCSNSRRMSRAR